MSECYCTIRDGKRQFVCAPCAIKESPKANEQNHACVPCSGSGTADLNRRTKDCRHCKGSGYV